MLKFDQSEKKILKPVYDFAKYRRVKLYLVGGVLRDKLIGRVKENPDFDFAIKKGAIKFGEALAKKLKCGFVVLDKEHGACRLVKRITDKTYTFDFTDFRGVDLASDLKHRDFTINSLALELEKVFLDIDLNQCLFDSCKAKEDILKKNIRVINNKSFSDDPLRILRAFSFACILDFEIDNRTLKLASLGRNSIKDISGERIRDELFKVFDSNKTYVCLARLNKLKILEIIFPEIKKMRGIGQGPYHHLDVEQHTLESIKQLEEILKGIKNPDIREYLSLDISSGRKRYSLLKLAALLHDIGKPKTLRKIKGRTTFHGHERVGLDIAKGIFKRLKLSNDEAYSLHKMILWHLRPGYLADTENPTARAKFRYFRDAGIEALSILILSLADQRATKGPLTTKKARIQHEKVIGKLIREYIKKSKIKKKERLIDGHAIMKKFNLEPSRLIGKLLKELEELQAIGKIKTREEAFKACEKLL